MWSVMQGRGEASALRREAPLERVFPASSHIVEWYWCAPQWGGSSRAPYRNAGTARARSSRSCELKKRVTRYTVVTRRVAQTLMATGDIGVTRKDRDVTPSAGSVTPGTIGKAALCAALGWTRPRLDRRLESDGSFPVAKRGTRAGGWEFDLAVVLTYLGIEPSVAAHPQAITSAKGKRATSAPSAEPKFTVIPPAGVEPVVHLGEQTARQRRDLVQAEILEDKLRRDRGELVQVEVMRQVLNTMLAHLGKGLDRLSDRVVERCGLPEEYGDQIRVVTDDLRRAMADELRVLLG